MENIKLMTDEIIKLKEIQTILISFFSYFGLIIYIISFFLLFYLNKISFIKSHYLSFILLSSITNLMELFESKDDLIKHIFIFTSYIIQFHLVISSFNKLLLGKNIFKTEKDFSIKNMLLIKFVLFPLITFPYSLIFGYYSKAIHFIQYISIMVFLLFLHDYIKKNLNDLIDYLKNYIKDNILIPYMDRNQLIGIYIFAKNLLVLLHFFILIFYITKFFEILLIKLNKIYFFIIIILLSLKIVFNFLFFICFAYITYLLNKKYKKIEIIQNDEDEIYRSNKGLKKIKNIEENKNIENELDDIENQINEKKNNYYKSLEKSQDEDNIIEIENLEEEENKANNFSSETDKLK